MDYKDFALKNSLPLIIGASLILSTLIGSYTFYSSRGFDNTLTVTGSTKERVTADMAKWTLRVEHIVDTGAVSSGYALVEKDMTRTRAFLKQQGFTDADITEGSATSNDYYESYGQTQVRKVAVSQSVSVKSNDIALIEKASGNVSQLAVQGVRVTPQNPEYLISNLADLRVSLIGKAVVDAQKRATEVTKAIGQSVGRLKSASSGVVQVMQPDSTDVSDYGQYDTSTKEKDVFVSVRAVFFVK
jgi:hypothetical protein